jgi:hypothetical protein
MDITSESREVATEKGNMQVQRYGFFVGTFSIGGSAFAATDLPPGALL